MADRRASLLTDHADALVAAMRQVREKRPWQTDAMVILPDHLHAIWTLPDGDANYPGRWRMIEALFTKHLRDRTDVNGAPWQSRYWEHTIRDEHDLAQHVAYVHYNPVKHGYVVRPVDWRWSTLHRYIRDGLVPADWAAASDLNVEE
ncbi:MAG: transposase [Burkholderiales bacterium]|nr:transposase [Burkholderiales bacterium]